MRWPWRRGLEAPVEAAEIFRAISALVKIVEAIAEALESDDRPRASEILRDVDTEALVIKAAELKAIEKFGPRDEEDIPTQA